MPRARAPSAPPMMRSAARNSPGPMVLAKHGTWVVRERKLGHVAIPLKVVKPRIGKEIQEKPANFGTCKFHFNIHLALLYLNASECLFFLALFGSIEHIVPSLITTKLSIFPPPIAHRIDKHVLNVVKLLRRKPERFIFIYLDALNDCRCAWLLYQRGECIAMAREHNA